MKIQAQTVEFSESLSNLSNALSVVMSIQRRDLNGVSLFSERYGKGLSFLLKRRYPADWVKLYGIVCEACISAIEAGEVTVDDEIPSLLRTLLQTIASQYPYAGRASRKIQTNESIVAEYTEMLSLFSPDQREALRRFYVDAEHPSSICENLGLSTEQFSFIKTVARMSVAGLLNSPKKLAQGDVVDHLLPATP